MDPKNLSDGEMLHRLALEHRVVFEAFETVALGHSPTVDAVERVVEDEAKLREQDLEQLTAAERLALVRLEEARIRERTAKLNARNNRAAQAAKREARNRRRARAARAARRESR